MIFPYILSLTILITSGILVADVFLSLDKNMAATRSEFVKKTKSMHKNQDGSITLMAILMTLMISGLLLFFTIKAKVELQEARYRKDSYLCFQYLNIETENYIIDISRFNILLRSLYAATLTGIAVVQAKAAFEVSTYARNTRHVFYIKNLLKNKYCKGASDSLSYLKNFPYEINKAFILQTSIDQTTKLKAQEWTVTHTKNPTGIRLKNSFCLRADLHAEGNLFPNFKIQTSEISMRGFSKLKCLSGFQ